MCVLCMFYIDWELGGRKKNYGRDFFGYKLVRVGLQETNHFFFLKPHSHDYLIIENGISGKLNKPSFNLPCLTI